MKFYVTSKLSENISVTPEGFLLVKNVVLTHTGALTYQKGEHPFDDVSGEVVMTRDPEELFSIVTLASFEGKDITIQHPKEFVSPDNYQGLTNGVMFNLRRHKEQIEVDGKLEDAMACDMLIKSAEAIELIENGVREVSLGYDAFWQLTGDNTGKHSSIRGNHCAIVEEGRAGKFCVINDHKKETDMTDKKEEQSFMDKVNERAKKLFGKTLDEKEKEDKDKEEADKKAKDEKEKEDKEKAEKSKDELPGAGAGAGAGGSVEERLGKLEESLLQLMDMIASGNNSSEDEEVEVVEDEAEEEEVSDADEGEEEEASDAEEEEDDKKSKKAGDTKSRAEILAPGIVMTKDVKAKALAVAYKTADGKRIINQLTGGKNPSTLKDETTINTVFVAAASMMKNKRVNDFASVKIKTSDVLDSLQSKSAKTPQEINEINKKFYGNK